MDLSLYASSIDTSVVLETLANEDSSGRTKYVNFWGFGTGGDRGNTTGTTTTK